MEAKGKRAIADGKEYEKYFDVALGTTEVIEKYANLSDTIDLMQKAIAESIPQTARISKVLKGKDIYETCKNIWHFVYKHIAYRRDEKGKEQVRTALRTWQDRHKGVDCDCYTVFICSILCNLGIANSFRIAKYNKNVGFQHVYPIVPYENARGYIVIDCVLDKFDKEHPFIEKKDYKITMENLGFITEDRKGYDYVPDNEFLNGEIGVVPILAVGAGIAKGGVLANILSKGSGILQNVGGAVGSVVQNVGKILGIGKNKEAADEAERVLTEAKGRLQALKTQVPQEIEQMRQMVAQAKQNYENELNQLMQVLNSI
ncbi:hypothetical protein [Raineya orbicola]|uniref:Transglutaminase-like superfamily n=1 Tax=Raineya orbicola TaxID=2016530 RepID=A0A2N3I820_9BACT|nr:hypothetical protein [Raineya orbicola]PKQ66446.1 hypothetical protein Rain11_2397 [Raineya orbicola]